jgi:hypothetical protein
LRVIQGEQSVYFDSARFAHDYYRNWVSLNALGAMTLEERKKPGRKLMFWFGEGWPWLSGEQNSFDWITEFYTRLREARITLFGIAFSPHPAEDSYPLSYLVGVKSATEARPANMALNVLAAQSGGGVLDGSTGLADPIIHCVENANAFSTISFDPPRTDKPDEYRKLKVQVDKPGLEARTNSGYYDQPVYYDQPYLAERVTVRQLEQVLGKAQKTSDAEAAQQLYGLELTERMSSTSLSAWKARLPGAKTWAALVALADASAFLKPPAAEIPATPPPDIVAQRLMLTRTVNYLMQTIPKLPNIFATRTTVRYEEPPQKDEQTWKTAIGDRLLRRSASSTATVLYRNGYEQVDGEIAIGKKPGKEEGTLSTRGTFGSILSTVVSDAARGDLRWSRWEQGAGGVRAVFSYAVPEEKSHYEVTYCCLADDERLDSSQRSLNLVKDSAMLGPADGKRMGVFIRLTGYHGEIAIDPASGAILRMTAEADLKPKLPLMRSDVLVEYGPQEIGRKTYICPIRSVSISRTRTVKVIHEWGESFRIHGPFETMLNDVSFGEYHMFRAESRVLTDYGPVEEEKQGNSAPGAMPKTQP